MPSQPLVRLLPLLLLLAACSGEPLAPGPNGSCATRPVRTVAVGADTVLDATTQSGCLRLPAAGAGGVEHLVVAVATAGQQAPGGVSASYQVATAGTAAAMLRQGPLAAFRRPGTAEEFHAMLRAREQALAPEAAAAHLLARAAPFAAPPMVGDLRSFNVCGTLTCSSFVQVGARALNVSGKAAIYVDTLALAGGYDQADIDAVATLFDNQLYPIDTLHFGRESDLDGNGVVVVLLTPAVNRLTPNCNGGSIVLGYFFGVDLAPTVTGSNNGEIFYSLVPDPSNPACTVPKGFATRLLAPTFIHEFQHMISYNQHVLLRGGDAENTWLNEGLSHFAEELGGRLVPDNFCVPNGSGTPDCFTQFAGGDVANGYDYLHDIEHHFLIEPGATTGTLEERGANWLFVRWLADHFGGDSLGTDLTQRLVATNRLGAANVASVTGLPFGQLVAEWQLANYLDDLPGFTPQNPRLQYKSWNFRHTFDQLHQQSPLQFDRAYPLVPDSTATGSFNHRGVLRAGSGLHLRVLQSANAAGVDLQLTDSLGQPISAATEPRLGVVRIH